MSGELGRLGWSVVLGAFVLVAAAPVLTLMGWRVLLADLGTHPPPPRPASSSSGSWGSTCRARCGPSSRRPRWARLHVPRRRMAVVGILSIGLAVLTGCSASRRSRASWTASRRRSRGGGSCSPSCWAACCSGRGCSTPSSPRAQPPGREPLEHELSGRAIALTSVWFVAARVSTGLGTFLLARSVAPDAPLGPLLVTSIGGFALASAAGMFSFLVPAGLECATGSWRSCW